MPFKMETIKETLDRLEPKQKALLEYAFQHSIGQVVLLPDRKYIAVHQNNGNKHLKEESRVGAWSIGKTTE
jgi:hypothetical protein